MNIRPATVEDAPALAQVHVTSWRETYRGLVPDAYLDSLSVPERTERWRGRLSGADPGAFTLVAEDDDVNALIATAFLEHQGMRAERVRDGAQAVRHALRDVNRPDLVLMDCRMPGMDGLTATRQIRAQEQALGLPRLPIIALTANSCEQTRLQCQAAGMDGFLGKPYTKEDLARLLQDLLPKAHELQDPPPPPPPPPQAVDVA